MSHTSYWITRAIRRDLRGADLSGANLSGANLRDADLRDADLRAADLSGADLRGADLRDADLRDADLSAAALSGANLRAANLSGANLSGANLRAADLRGANLRGANLRDANLRDAKEDLFVVLAEAPMEVPRLLSALRAGEIDGSCYRGACCCLVGTIANARGCDVDDLPDAIQPNSSRPAEKWFMVLKPGHTPETFQPAKITEEWILEWLADKQQAA